MDIVQMSPKVRLQLRKRCLSNFFNFAVAVMGYDDISDDLHRRVCDHLSTPANRKQVTLPRSFVKTWLSSIAYPIWITLQRTTEEEFPYYKAWEDKYWQLGPNMRILIASYVISNSFKMIGLIRKTYENNLAMQILFPEVIPENFNKVKWSDEHACIKRTEDATESTYECAGIGGASTSRHYDLIIEDDLIYAKKDDFSGQELQPNQDDIDKAIGWHKLATSLLVPGKHAHIHNIGTRWAKHDLVDFIWTHEKSYDVFKQACVYTKPNVSWKECQPAWPEMYDHVQLQMIADAQGSYMFSTQYLLEPIAPEEKLFKLHWLQYYNTKEELPKNLKVYTTIDLSGWKKSKNTRSSRGVVISCGWDENNHLWILDYDVGRFNPSEIINLMYRHWNTYNPVYVAVETVYYQEALVHFLRKEMDIRGWMRLRELHTSTAISKDLRIRALEPYAEQRAIHCKPSHEDFITEYTDYVPDANITTKDILDALAYQLQVAKPGRIKVGEAKPKRLAQPVNTVDEMLNAIWKRKRSEHRVPMMEQDELGHMYDMVQDHIRFDDSLSLYP